MATRKRHKKKTTVQEETKVVEEKVSETKKVTPKKTEDKENKEKRTIKIEDEIIELPPKKKYSQEEIDEATRYAEKETLKELLPYLIIIICVIVIRTFIVTPVDVSGESMMPTLENGDIMLLYKLRLKTVGINRFDIVVIKTDDGKLIKRVIGLPGETIKYEITNNKEDKKAILYINDQIIEEDFGSFDNLLETCKWSSDICTGEVKIPKDEYYVMGDNRGNSKDSRMIGTIKKEDIKGITSVVIFPFSRFGSVNK